MFGVDLYKSCLEENVEIVHHDGMCLSRGAKSQGTGLALQTSPIGVTSAHDMALPFYPHLLLLQAYPSSFHISLPVSHLRKVYPQHFASIMAHEALSYFCARRC